MTVREQTFGARVVTFSCSYGAAVQTLLCSDDCPAAQSLTHFYLAFLSVSHGLFASISCAASRPRFIGVCLFFLLCLSFRVPAPTAPEAGQRTGWLGTTTMSLKSDARSLSVGLCNGPMDVSCLSFGSACPVIFVVHVLLAYSCCKPFCGHSLYSQCHAFSLSVLFLMWYGEKWQSGHFQGMGKITLRVMSEDSCTKRTLEFNREHPGTAPLTRKLI